MLIAEDEGWDEVRDWGTDPHHVRVLTPPDSPPIKRKRSNLGLAGGSRKLKYVTLIGTWLNKILEPTGKHLLQQKLI